MSRRDRLANGVDRALLTTLMLGIAFVMERAIDRIGEKRPEREHSRLGRRLFRQFLPTAHLEHQHAHQGEAP